MGKNRMEQRRIAEAAERMEKDAPKTKKKTAKKRKTTKRKTTTRRTKATTLERKRMIWCVFNGSMKEEARFPYDEREAAEEKMEALRAKATKKLYFLQPIKEAIPDAPPREEDDEDEE